MSHQEMMYTWFMVYSTCVPTTITTLKNTSSTNTQLSSGLQCLEGRHPAR